MLNRIPFWGWFVIILVALYLVYNPLGYSLVHMWIMSDPTQLLPFKVLATLAVGSVLGVIIYGTVKSTSLLGFLLLLALVTSVLWSAQAILLFDVLSVTLWSWLAQPVLASIITTGWQWPKIWRRSHGSVSVDDPDTPP